MTTTKEATVRRRLLTFLATAALAAVAPMSVAATPQEGAQPPESIGVRLLDVPADRADDPRAAVAIVDHVQPGGRLSRRMEIVSTVDEPVVVDVYAGNGQVVNGAFVPDDDGGRGVADWITVGQGQVTLDANGAQTVEVALDVPTSAPNGEYYGFIWVEPPASEAQVSVANRVGVRIYLSVGTGDEPQADFAIGSMTAKRTAEGVPVVTVQLRNTGGRALDITGDLFLSDGPAGLSAGPFAFDGSISLRPGELGSMTISLDPELPDGPWTATLTAFSGLLERTAEAEISFPEEAGEEAPPADSDTIAGTDAEGKDISEELRNQRRVLLPLAAILILMTLAALYVTQWMKRPTPGAGGGDAPAEASVDASDGEA